jgi:hypothetical protein
MQTTKDINVKNYFYATIKYLFHMMLVDLWMFALDIMPQVVILLPQIVDVGL